MHNHLSANPVEARRAASRIGVDVCRDRHRLVAGQSVRTRISGSTFQRLLFIRFVEASEQPICSKVHESSVPDRLRAGAKSADAASRAWAGDSAVMNVGVNTFELFVVATELVAILDEARVALLEQAG
jgi:hypothetical protein